MNECEKQIAAAQQSRLASLSAREGRQSRDGGILDACGEERSSRKAIVRIIFARFENKNVWFLVIPAKSIVADACGDPWVFRGAHNEKSAIDWLPVRAYSSR